MARMQSEVIRDLLRGQPFEPIELALSDGRSVEIRHPDQAVVSRRHLYVALAHVKQGRKRLASPKDGETIATEWILLNLVQIVSAEPANGRSDPPKRKNSTRRKR